MDYISIEDFAKIDLRVATVYQAEAIEGSEKLIRLHITLGDEKRIILAGLKQYYAPEQLLSKQIIIVANLQPRQMMGEESQGMLLAARGTNGSVILIPEKQVDTNSKIS
ncbi:MAG: Methionine-tRNA ligase [Parcubacteria group bacterium GW2011_GWC1_41_7]|nr:MAG: Methionine-tRNA ligase [Parcubacteria group bacterium GW2011_GWC1_41_7]